MNWRNTLIRTFAGGPGRVALNLTVTAGIGVAFGHGVLGVPLTDGLAMAAMTPGLLGIVAAAILKEKALESGELRR